MKETIENLEHNIKELKKRTGKLPPSVDAYLSEHVRFLNFMTAVLKKDSVFNPFYITTIIHSLHFQHVKVLNYTVDQPYYKELGATIHQINHAIYMCMISLLNQYKVQESLDAGKHFKTHYPKDFDKLRSCLICLNVYKFSKDESSAFVCSETCKKELLETLKIYSLKKRIKKRLRNIRNSILMFKYIWTSKIKRFFN